MQPLEYPQLILYAALGLGIPLAVARPRQAFLAVVFLISAANAEAFTFTRTPLLGPFFNAHDACLLVGLLSLLTEALRHRHLPAPRFPSVLIAIVAVLLIGLVESLWLLGPLYEVFRQLRWALALVLYFAIAARLVRTPEMAGPLVAALLFGSVVSSVQYLLFVRGNAPADVAGAAELTQLRNMAYRNPGVWLLLAGLVWIPRTTPLKRIVVMASGVLFAMAVLLNQTRSIWLASLSALPVLILVFRQSERTSRTLRLALMAVVISIGVFVAMRYVTPTVDPSLIIGERFDTLGEERRDISTLSRQHALKYETDAWLGGTVVFGRGLYYFANMPNTVAWNHLGHITTLAQLGLLGFIVYSIWLPLVAIRDGRSNWRHSNPSVRFIGLLAGAATTWCWICFWMSDGFMQQQASLGVIMGASWGLSHWPTLPNHRQEGGFVHDRGTRAHPHRL